MAKPRVFVSSTYYDLKHIRTSLELFIRSLGYEPILSEKGDIAFTPDKPLDESCYREAKNSDIYVLIIGGRYGSEASRNKKETKEAKSFYAAYESITRQEYKAAAAERIPIYILIEKAVYAEYQTYLNNKGNEGIRYAHVDSVNVFKFIEEILAQRANNPVQPFERHSEIESWLRDQWAGLFREQLRNLVTQPQLASMSTQISELAEVNKTLKAYLEKLLSTTGSKVSSRQFIKSESKRLDRALMLQRLNRNDLIDYLKRLLGTSAHQSLKLMKDARSFEDFLKRVAAVGETSEDKTNRIMALRTHSAAVKDYQEARMIAGLAPQNKEEAEPPATAETNGAKETKT